MSYNTLVRSLVAFCVAVSLLWFVSAHTHAYCGRATGLVDGVFITTFNDEPSGGLVIGIANDTTECGLSW